MSRITLLTILSLIPLLAACGSNTDAVRSAVSHMQDVITSYNNANPGSLAATADACSKAENDLKDSSALESTKLTGKLGAEQKVLRQAYVLARNGFRDCASGASTLDFPQVSRGEQQIAAANAAIARARRMER